MKHLITSLLLVISLNCYSQQPDNVDVDSVIYYFIEMVNKTKFERGPVFEGRVITRYVRRFWEKKGKFVNDTIWERWEPQRMLVLDSGLTICAEYQAEYLRLYNNSNDDGFYISHYQKEGEVDNYNILETPGERADHFKVSHFSEIVTGGSTTFYPENESVNKMIAKEAYGNFDHSKPHKSAMLNVRNTKIGVSMKFLDNGINFIFLSTLD